MTRPLIRVTLVIVLITTASAKAQQFPSFDPERFFMLGDADLDGRLSLDEYRDFLRFSPRMKGTEFESLFLQFDTDRDGFLSLAEYRKSLPQRRGIVPANSGVTNSTRFDAPVVETVVTPEQEQLFETKIRPILSAHCFKCHSSRSEKLEGGFRMDSREELRLGGNSGLAIVPGQPDDSLLIRAIRHEDDKLQMPPAGKLADAVIADFEAWVKMGAPDPRRGASNSTARPGGDHANTRDFWSFRPPKRSIPPAVNRTDWPRDDIDRFLLAALEGQGLSPVADASRSRLLRRVTFDLVGLPPTPEELNAFLSDESHDAFARVVDQLLMSPRFGERWGRYWLDVARYAESSGKTNFTYPHAWRYRDWAIKSFNDDKPYDQFLREQIAGDLLPAGDDRQRAEQLIATGFLAVGSKAHDAESRGQFVLDLIDEQIEATTRAFLGLTVACARCHDHKMDPITQRDYYALAGIFRSTQTCSGTLAGNFPNFNASPLIELPSGAKLSSAIPALTIEQRTSMEGRLADLIRDRDAIPPGEANRDRLRRTTSMLSMLRLRLLIDRPGDSPRTFAMGARDRDEAVDSPLYLRGELDQPGIVVPRGILRLLNDDPVSAIVSGSGRRELADWIASPLNPLTARVIVNRVWLHLFGKGLVQTPDNFGAAGASPSHPELLDTLAVDLMKNGWSIKRLIRRIVLSRAYGLDSAFDQRSFEVDPDNVLVWRMSKRRLDAEAVRDSLLFVGGRLETTPPVGSPVARVGEGLALFVRTEGFDTTDTHRSVYLPVIRDQIPEVLALFDFADPSVVTGNRPTTSGPAQALYFMNGQLVIRQADAIADRVLSIQGDDDIRIDAAYRIVLTREPTIAERDRAVAFLRKSFADAGTSESIRVVWSTFCQALLASAEFRYVD